MAQDKFDFDDKAFDMGWGGDTRSMLSDLHHEEEMSIDLIGRFMGCSGKTVRNAMRLHRVVVIPTFTSSSGSRQGPRFHYKKAV
jgi:hypothetical protein